MNLPPILLLNLSDSHLIVEAVKGVISVNSQGALTFPRNLDNRSQDSIMIYSDVSLPRVVP